MQIRKKTANICQYKGGNNAAKVAHSVLLKNSNDLTVFQVGFSAMFPDWDSILNFREVILFACGLTARSKTILEFVYYTLQQNFIKYDTKETRHFLSSLCQEVSEAVELDPFCNKCINYVTVSRRPVFIPSNFYVFHSGYGQNLPTRQDIKRSGFGEIPRAQCTIVAKSTDMFVRIMAVLRYIKQYQEMFIHALHLKNVQIRRTRMKKNEQPDSNSGAALFLHTIHFSANTKSVEIWGCRLSKGLFRHLARELQHCERMEKLNIFFSNRIPKELGDSVANMKTLKELEIWSCKMRPDVRDLLLCGLSQCLQLVKLNLINCTLTNCLAAFLCADDHPGFKFLEKLELTDTALSKNDVETLSTALHNNMLPQLKKLYLSENSLTGCLKDLLPTRSQLYSLNLLWLCGTALCRADVTSLAAAIKAGRLPHLSSLNLEKNNLVTMVDETKNLIGECLARYTAQGLQLDFENNNLLDEFRERMKSQCRETSVHLEI